MQDATATVTDAERAEWNALHDRMQELVRSKERAQGDIAYYLDLHVKAGAMTLGEYGIPSTDAIDAYQRACAAVAEAKRFGDQWSELHAQSEAHPYTAIVRGRTTGGEQA